MHHGCTLPPLQVGRYGPELFDFGAERVTRSVTESLQRLQIPYIDLIQCHDIEFGSLDQVRPRLQQCYYWQLQPWRFGVIPHAAWQAA